MPEARSGRKGYSAHLLPGPVISIQSQNGMRRSLEHRARYWNQKPRQGWMPSDPFPGYDYSHVALISAV